MPLPDRADANGGDSNLTLKVKATPSLTEKLWRYDRAKRAAARWKQEESDLKELILAELGYDPDDPKPEPVIVEDDEGNEVFTTRRGTWRGLNQKYLKEHHPHIYAECETSKATLTIKYQEITP